MSRILKLDRDVDLWLTFTWSSNNHGICGHTFEVLEYFYILKEYFNVGILFAEDIGWETIETAIRSRYTFTNAEITEIQSKTVFANRPTLVQAQNILFVDGGVINAENYTLLVNNVLHFSCGNKQVKDNNDPSTYILQDDRVYDPVKLNGINYKKRILFDKLKPIGSSQTNALLYVTKNCRQFDNLDELRVYNKHILAVCNTENKGIDTDFLTYRVLPLENFFEQFDTYIYTPVSRKWDCSPRLIAECKHYGKEVIYHNIDYWDVDCGLYWRKWDIENDFESIRLTPGDEIVNIVQNIIC